MENFIKAGAFANFGQKLWPKRLQVPIPTIVNIGRHQKSQKNYCHHWIHHTRFVQKTKFHQDWKICHFWFKTVAWKITGTNIDRCQYWQASRITKKFAIIDFKAFDFCRVLHFIKTEALATLAQNYCHHWIHQPS